MIHYPLCWDTAAYPTLESAIDEALAWSGCSVCESAAQPQVQEPASKTERQLRKMLCIQRHGAAAYMDDGEASFGGDDYHRSIDYMRETPQAIRQAWSSAGLKKFKEEPQVQEPSEVDELLLNLGLDPEKYRTEAGYINHLKVKAAIHNPREYCDHKGVAAMPSLGGQLCKKCGVSMPKTPKEQQ
jgi:hypothetical protein